MIKLIPGDALEQLRLLPAGSVHCCVTSPPYYGLRDYGTAQWQGGDADCAHIERRARQDGGRSQINGFHGSTATDSHKGEINYRNLCSDCGARRIDSQIGLETTPDDYIAALVAVFREVRRVLRPDGTLWVNIGDSYCAPGGGFKPDAPSNLAGSKQARSHPHATQAIRSHIVYGAKPKDLLGIPWMLAFALRADGWYLRQDIIWAKPNPMPESVTDRCTKAHEYLFLLSKSERYWFDAAAIAEPGVEPERQRLDRIGGANGHLVRHSPGAMIGPSPTRNKRSVWTVPSNPFPEAHFATFPPALIEPCILAGCPRGGTTLDPFAGAGTTGLVADRLGRDAVLIELNPVYCAMIRNRITADAPLFVEFANAAD